MIRKNKIIVVGGLIKKNEKYLITRRKNGHLSGFWEFPGGKVEKNESEKNALKRELKEELSLSVRVGDFVDENTFQYKKYQILLRIYLVELENENFTLNEHDKAEWVSLHEMKDYKFAPADIPIIKNLVS